MLIAIDEQRRFINSGKYTRETLRQWQRHTFKCPQCHERVMLKVGDVTVPHFAHYPQSTCTSTFSEGETLEHMQSKLQLYEQFRTKCELTKLEPTLQTCPQRPDILIRERGKAYALEYQWTPISMRQLQERTATYERYGIIPIWLAAPPQRQTTHPVQQWKLNRFYRTIFEVNRLPYFLYYSSSTRRFTYGLAPVHIQADRFIVYRFDIPLRAQTFPFRQFQVMRTVSVVQQYVELYVQSRSTFIHNRLRRRGKNDWLHWCDELKLIPSLLVNWIGIPTSGHESFRQHDAYWQLHVIAHSWNRYGYWSDETASHYCDTYQCTARQRQAVRAYIQTLQRYNIHSFHDRLERSAFRRIVEERIVANRHNN